MKRQLRILQVNATDIGGGAARIAHDMFSAYAKNGHASWLVVGKKKTTNQNVFQIPNDTAYSLWEKINFKAANLCKPLIGKVKGTGRLKNLFDHAARYRNFICYVQGKEQFDYPGSRKLLELVPNTPDIIHCHNLHSKFFDLRLLPTLSNKFPLVMTLHDAWLLSGHCAHSLSCEKWKIGCGQCNDLTIYPALRKDGTRYNWKLKRSLFAQSKLYVVTPSQWLMNNVKQSMLTSAQLTTKVINNGINLNVFKPADKKAIRKKLDLPENAKIITFVANSVRKNIWKDYATFKKSLEILATLMPQKNIIALCIGEDAPTEHAGHIPIHFKDHNDTPDFVVNYYQAADVHVHAANADNFPTVILEALACGTPVIATGIDGIPEQIKSIQTHYSQQGTFYDEDKATGLLVNRSDAQGIAQGLRQFFTTPTLLKKLSNNAVLDAQKRFDQNLQIKMYLEFYDDVLSDFHASKKQPQTNVRERL